MSIEYAKAYREIDFRKYPDKYPIGRGEQGVLIAEPYKSEILPFWKFASPEDAEISAKKIFQLFISYKERGEFVGMDMTRKFLQMGFTRSRRYANHRSGKKYTTDGSVRKQDPGSEGSLKAESARIFYKYYDKVRQDKDYIAMRRRHLEARSSDEANSFI